MKYRMLGRTGLEVSEIGLGGEWLERHNTQEVKEVVDACEQAGINILDCWMSEPNVRSNIGKALAGRRNKWYIQGHIGSTWQDGQYVRTRQLHKVKEAFEDLLTRMQTDYIDLGMIHFVDETAEFDRVIQGEFMAYVRRLKETGRIRHIGLSTHNPDVARLAAEQGEIEMILFSVNPAFDLRPATENIDEYFAEEYEDGLAGIAPEREALYKICEQQNVGITVMKGYAGGRLFDAKTSPFGVALTPVQCLHYGIDIAMVNKLYDLAVMQEEVPATIRAHYEQLKASAADCIGCKACESRCPFQVAVAERMEKAKSLFQ